MALTKIHWYFGVLLVVAVLFTSLLLFGNDISTKSGITLDNDSYVYINQYAMYLEDSSIDDLAESNLVNLKNDSLLTDQEGAPSVTDFLATINYYKSRVTKISNNLKLIYNFPTLIVNVTGLPIGEFNHILNIIGWILFASMLLLLIKLMRGS